MSTASVPSDKRFFSTMRTRPSGPLTTRSWAIGGLSIAAFALNSLGCMGEVYAESPAGVDYVEGPVVVESYPRTYYEGGYVYYGDGRWYRQTPRGWAYYRSEPEALYRHRTQVLITAPPPRRPEVEHRDGKHDNEHEHEHDREHGHR